MQLQKVSPYVFPGIAAKPKKVKDTQLDMLTGSDVIIAVCKHTGVDIASIGIKTHARHIADARFLIFYLCLKLVPNAYTNNMRKIIGIDKDHSTVIHGNRSVTDRISVYPDYAAFVQTIEAELHTLNSTRLVGKYLKPITGNITWSNETPAPVTYTATGIAENKATA